MLGLNKKTVVEAYRAVRPVVVSVVALAAIACVMACKGWEGLSALIAGVILLLSIILIAQVHRTSSNLLRQSSNVRQAACQAEEHYVKVLRRIMRFTEARENYARGRSERIGHMAEAIARKLNLGEEKCALMNVAGQLHDIGLLGVSETILNKRAALGSKDFRTIQKHAEISYEMLLPLPSLKEVLPAIRWHHERMNGTGYPDGIAGDKIPLEARILAVADSYDAMTHDRPHRSAMTSIEALRELQRCSPAGYDAQCVEALGEIIHLPQLQEAIASVEATQEEQLA